MTRSFRALYLESRERALFDVEDEPAGGDDLLGVDDEDVDSVEEERGAVVK
jgi:hypothetical protein